ncbi:hypothetical protein LP414_20230 [Polaromonas sp. P1(28)-13]|nr:hypothetical protein LP414_20230 [Polaromonas sp. P1(28)-13]
MTEIRADVLAGLINPGQLVIVREILPGSGGFDTAMFSGRLAEYTVVTNADGSVTVTDGVAERDGVDRLTNIERLQFADQAVVLAPGLNNEPVGALTILDAATNTPDGTPTEGQLLRASIAGVTDADNPGGAITGPIAFFWQFEAIAGSGRLPKHRGSRW